jgi:hypothetical protein
MEQEEKAETARLRMLKEEWNWLQSAGKRKTKARVSRYEEMANQVRKVSGRKEDRKNLSLLFPSYSQRHSSPYLS